LPARYVPADFLPSGDDDAILESYLPPLGQRTMGLIEAAIERPDLFDYDTIRVSVMNNFKLLRRAVRGARAWRNADQFDVDDIGALPKRFIFYPIQYTPESSINIPSPYFVDQFRVIDAVRYAMPSDCMLVVKEHPACVEMRPIKFMREVRSLPGVVVAKASIPAIELIKHAAVTVTVTGTAALEALLLGRPALALSPGLCAWAIGSRPSLGDLRAEIASAITRTVSNKFIIDQIAKLMNVRYPFLHATAHMVGEPMLRRGNIRRFLAALLDHIERERQAKEKAA
jgi:hypothetical protein